MEIRAKWNNMIDADKCQYNGYSDFLNKEGSRRKVEADTKVKDAKDLSSLKERNRLSRIK